MAPFFLLNYSQNNVYFTRYIQYNDICIQKIVAVRTMMFGEQQKKKEPVNAVFNL